MNPFFSLWSSSMSGGRTAPWVDGAGYGPKPRSLRSAATPGSHSVCGSHDPVSTTRCAGRATGPSRIRRPVDMYRRPLGSAPCTGTLDHHPPRNLTQGGATGAVSAAQGGMLASPAGSPGHGLADPADLPIYYHYITTRHFPEGARPCFSARVADVGAGFQLSGLERFRAGTS